MHYNIKITIFIMLIFITGCSMFKKVVYHPNINQGNYLTEVDIAKINIGMNKQQVTYILGTAMLKDPFGSNTWYYISRREFGHNVVKQYALILTFNNSDVLISINNQPSL